MVQTVISRGVCFNNGIGTCCAAGETCAYDPATNTSACAAPSGCPAGTTDCNGSCVDLSGDVTNCGSCGNVCSGGAACNAPLCSGGCTTAPANEGGSCYAGSGTCSSGVCQPNGACIPIYNACVPGVDTCCSGSGCLVYPDCYGEAPYCC